MIYSHPCLTASLTLQNKMEPTTGLEPATRCLQNSCSTTELLRHERDMVTQNGPMNQDIWRERGKNYTFPRLRVRTSFGEPSNP